MAKAKDELNSRKFNDSRKKFENQLNDLASQEPLKLSPRPSADLWDTLNKNDRAVSPELIINSNPISIPNSYEEIYKISQKNRLKNKEKKRFRDHEDDNALAGDSVADSITEGVTKTDTSSVASSLQSLPDNLEGGDTWLKSHNQSMDQIYFTKLGQPVDCSLDGTVSIRHVF